MQTFTITDKKLIEEYLLQYPHLNFYHLGDLDDFFWPYTTWFANKEKDEINAICLLYTGLEPAVLLAILNENESAMEELINNILPSLPNKFYAHLSPGLEDLFYKDYQLEHHGEHLKMFLDDPTKLQDIGEDDIKELTKEDLKEVQSFYKNAYPGNWFDPRMLETNQYLGIRNKTGELICVGGVHTFSEKYDIAVIGNIATLPEFREQGHGTKLAKLLSRKILSKVKGVGLNVHSDNKNARKLYKKIGFTNRAIYHEWMLEEKSK